MTKVPTTTTTGTIKTIRVIGSSTTPTRFLIMKPPQLVPRPIPATTTTTTTMEEGEKTVEVITMDTMTV